MAEIASFGVDVDKNTKLAQNAQDTADEAGTGIGDLNDPNKLAPAEKATLKRKYDTDVLLYGMDTKKLTDNHLSTSEIDSAMSALTAYMTPFFANMSTTDTVNRDALNTVYKDFDTADKNADSAFTNMVSSAASDAMVAGNQAKIAGSEAIVAGNQASEAASNASVQASMAVSNANVANNNATSGIEIARSAANDAEVVSEAVTALKGGSTLTIEQLENGLRTKITAGDITGGGRNLIAGSNTDVVLDDAITKQGWEYTTIFSNLVAGQQYTFSSDIVVNAGSPSLIRLAEFNKATNSSSVNSNVPINNGHIQWTFTAVSDQPLLLIYAGTDGTTAGNKVTFHHYQLETGIIAHDWQQAPEDFSQLVETKTADLAETMVKNSDFATYKDQTADTLQNIVTKSPSNIIKDGGFNNATIGQAVKDWDMALGQIVANPDTVSSLVATGHPVLQINGIASGNSDLYYGDWFDVQPGDQFYTEFKARWSSVSQKGDIIIGLETCNTSWGDLQWPGGTSTSAPGSWGKFTGTVTVGANAVHARVWVSWQGSAQAGGAVQVTDLVVRPAYSTQSDITQSINNIHLGFQNPDGSKFQMNLSADGTALMDFSKIMLNGDTNIANGTIGNAQIANGAISQAKIANAAIGNAQIADLAVTSAKVSEIDASLIKSGIIDTNRLDAYSIIANVINGKTITGITINTPTLNLGLNGQFTESYDYTQATGWFLPKKASGTVTFNHGVIEDQGTMQSYVNGTWGAINDSSVFTSGMTNNVWTEYAPGYYKIDMYKQGSITNVLQRAYADPTGYYYTDAAGDKTYLGNILQTPQVQTPSLFATVLNQMPGQLRMRMVANGSDWGLQVGSYSGSEAVLSDFIYNSTSSSSANLHITANGHIVRSTSASKYKYNIKHAIDEDSLADKLLTMHVSTWNDKHAVDSYAQTLTDNNESEDISIEDNYGLIAEDLRDAGLDMFIEYGKNHTIEGIEYDRAWLPLLPKMRQMNDKINEYELRISKLEAKINE